tara:strand:+ start:4097 stop:5200 length:1104 start_codon:yes stop_codon:yes gene_type:complete
MGISSKLYGGVNSINSGGSLQEQNKHTHAASGKAPNVLAPFDSEDLTFVVGSVKQVCLDPNNLKIFDDPSQNSVGSISMTIISGPGDNEEEIARPLFSNIKQYPLPNEVVFAIKLQYAGTGQNKKFNYFYFPPINSINSSHHNAGLAGVFNFNDDETLLGDNFVFNEDARNLLHFEGDVIVEGRNRNSIRLGSSVTPAESTENEFSVDSEDGTPIIIISNGHEGEPISGGGDGTEEVLLESVNDDSSVIYLTKDQMIPLTPVNTLNLKGDPLDAYIGSSQIILNSDRLVFNTKNDDIILASANNIAMSTAAYKVDLTDLMDLIGELIADVEKLSQGTFPTGVGPTGPHPSVPGTIAQIKSKFDQLAQ